MNRGCLTLQFFVGVTEQFSMSNVLFEVMTLGVEDSYRLVRVHEDVPVKVRELDWSVRGHGFLLGRVCTGHKRLRREPGEGKRGDRIIAPKIGRAKMGRRVTAN
jgi:hypothetical protein